MKQNDSRTLEPDLYELFIPIRGGYSYINRVTSSFPNERDNYKTVKLGIFHGLELAIPLVSIIECLAR